MDFDLNNLDGEKLLLYVFLILGLIYPGISYFYLNNEIKIFEFWQFILLSLFYSIPVFVFGLVFNMSDPKNKKELDSKKKRSKKLESLVLSTSYQLLIFSIGGLIVHQFFVFKSNNEDLNYLPFFYIFAIFMYLKVYLDRKFMEIKKRLKENTFWNFFIFFILILFFLFVLISVFVSVTYDSHWFLKIILVMLFLNFFYKYFSYKNKMKSKNNEKKVFLENNNYNTWRELLLGLFKGFSKEMGIALMAGSIVAYLSLIQYHIDNGLTKGIILASNLAYITFFIGLGLVLFYYLIIWLIKIK